MSGIITSRSPVVNSRSSRSEVLEAVKQNGWALQYASAALKDDRQIVLEAVKQDGYALEYASAALKDDREIVLEVVKQDPVKKVMAAGRAV